ncbi:unnamed protein product [Rotaria magnacalcarata]|uniref:Uncharacterized protein n=1 Tax=Rotaria magnacalcarata TaxID=392030 RepID=A0A819BTL2_9BILA|nr:unnamed protein product [Rotaria magnacalcarata]CAF3807434.1 unnamed protein product [Rotaria magnacalcarata]
MKNTTSNEYATIRCKGIEEMKITDFSTIASKVIACTIKLTGNQHDVSALPIYLTVYKKSIQEDLTLIDLPGITRNPVGGQSKDIYEKTVKLIMRYIEPPTAIILHVIPSSVDFTTSESIKISKEYDPNGERQLIAASKIDKYDKGIGDKLQGIGPGSMALKLGCVAVLNRTQEEIDQNISFQHMRRREQDFFTSSKASKTYLHNIWVVNNWYLARTYRSDQAKETRIKTNASDCWTLYNNIVKQYQLLVHARVHGIYDGDFEIKTQESPESSATRSLMSVFKPVGNNSLDDRIALQLYRYQKYCATEISKSFSPFFSPEYQGNVVKLLEENASVALPNFPSFSIIQQLCHHEARKIQKSCINLIGLYVEYLKKVLVGFLNQVFVEETNYKHRITQKLTDIILRSLDESEEHCTKDVNKMLTIEQRVFTLNHYYMDTVYKIKIQFQKYESSNRLATVVKAVQSNVIVNDFEINVAGLSNEYQAALDVQIAISAYCRVVQKRVADEIAQLCHYWLITCCALVMDAKFSSAFTSAVLFEWMREPFDQQQKLENLKRSILAMERALMAGQSV